MTEEHSMTVTHDDGKNTGWREKYMMAIVGHVSKYSSYTVPFLPSIMTALGFGSWICLNPQVQTHLVDSAQRTAFSQWIQSLTVGNP